MEIRVATQQDLGALVGALGQREFFVDRIGRTRQRAGVLLIAWCGGEPVGDVYLWCEPLEEPELRATFPGVPLLNHLEVAAPWRRRGIGTALVHACEQAALARGHDVLLLGVGLDNPEAKRLYDRLGYLDWGGGPIVTHWTEPDDAGGVKHVELDIDVMVRSMSAPPLSAWAAWHPRELAKRLTGVSRPWYVAGGWALDLWRETLGRPPAREHSDVEIGIPRPALREFAAALPGLELYGVCSGAVWPLRGSTPRRNVRQVWAAEDGAYRTDLFLEGGAGRQWIFKRDARIRLPIRAATGRTPDGVPFLRPEIVLLYKAAHRRPKDEADLEATLPLLDAQARAWLVKALDLAHPGHPWRARVGVGKSGPNSRRRAG